MAHFAELDDNNTVLRVIVVNDDDCKDSTGQESELVGASFCANLLGGRWVQTSFNSSFRRNFASVGGKYNEASDCFVSLKPFPSWILNEETAQWEAPVSHEDVDGQWFWHEDEQQWTR